MRELKEKAMERLGLLERGNGWTYATDVALERARKFAKGRYQDAILTGHEALSGSTLRGAAKDYSMKYKRSAQSVIGRVRSAGIRVNVRIVGRRHVLVIW